MNYFSEQDIRDIVTSIVTQAGGNKAARSGGCNAKGQEILVEISARHVHLDRETMDILFGKGSELTPKRDLSQPGQFLSEERVKLVTAKGEISNVGVLGPLRPQTQVELSFTDARILGLKAPIRLSGDLDNSADVIIIGPKGVAVAKNSTIIAKAHAHMTPADARNYGVKDGEIVSLELGDERKITMNNVLVRVSDSAGLAVHIDYDEANAANVSGSNIVGRLIKNG